MIRLKNILNIFIALAFCTSLNAETIIRPLNYIQKNSRSYLWNVADIEMGSESGYSPADSEMSGESKKRKAETAIDPSPKRMKVNSSNGAEAILKILNVGQGNFVVLEVPGEDNSQIMVIDGGSNASGTIPYTNSQTTNNVKLFSQSTPSIVGAQNMVDAMKGPTKITPEAFVTHLKSHIFGERKNISIKTILLTHLDLDHYNKLADVFNDTKVKNIILSGDISSYKDKLLPKNSKDAMDLDNGMNSDDKKAGGKFLKWLETKHGEGTKIFMPGASYDAIPNTTTVADFIKKNLHRFAPTSYKGTDDEFHIVDAEEEVMVNTSPKKVGQHYTISANFKEAFNFGNDVKIYPLSINPLREINPKHKKLQRKETSQYDYGDPGEVHENDDSTVIKIVNGPSSALLTGDATEETYNSIKANFKKNTDFLKSNILLLSHHGTDTKGSNAKEWLELISPEYIAVSHATTFKTTVDNDVFNNLSALKSLLTTENTANGPDIHHNLKISKGKESKQKYFYGRETHKHIFSTLSSGNLMFELKNDGKIELAIENNIVTDANEKMMVDGDANEK